jgi:FixJ family two-component response regulator
MLVDDDVDLVDSNRIMLSAKGHQVLGVHSENEARQELEGFGPDVLILDVMMDRIYSGMDYAKEVHKQFPTLPILMVSGFNDILKEKMEFTPGETLLPIAKFLDKPVTAQDLLKEVETLLARQ